MQSPAEPAGGSPPPTNPAITAQQLQPNRRLRILCLHGFRQSARGFKGRTHALRRRVKDLAELVFIDAPHELPAWDRLQEGWPAPVSHGDGTALPAAAEPAAGQHSSQQLDGQRQQPSAPAAKRAWLLVPEQHAALQQSTTACDASTNSGGGKSAPPFATDPGQFKQQTAGWQESQAAIQQALDQLGPFDGVLGLSQGAAVAAVLVAQQWQAQQRRAQQQDAAGPLQFVVLCSGYRSRVPEHALLLSQVAAAGGITLPSLHVFGGGSGDRQISTEESSSLVGCFHPAQRTEVLHGAGHLIPSSGPVVAALREFLAQQHRQLLQHQQHLEVQLQGQQCEPSV